MYHWGPTTFDPQQKHPWHFSLVKFALATENTTTEISPAIPVAFWFREMGGVPLNAGKFQWLVKYHNLARPIISWTYFPLFPPNHMGGSRWHRLVSQGLGVSYHRGMDLGLWMVGIYELRRPILGCDWKIHQWIHPGRLTWNPKMEVWKMISFSNRRFQVPC